MSYGSTQHSLDLPLVSPPSSGAEWLDVLPPQADVLRVYQRGLLARIAAAMRAYRRICAQAPTGAGKTHIIATIVAAAVLFGLRVLVLATRTRLVRQLHDRLDMFDIGHGVIAASLPGLTNWSQPVQVASVDTLYRRCIADQRAPLPLADVVIFDEAHLATGASRQAILNSYPNAWQFGFTATPATTAGAPLSQQFDELVLGPTVAELIEAKMLVRPRIFSVPLMTERELKSISKNSATDDYATGESSRLMSRPKLVGDVVQNWLRIANGRRTLVFACDKAHGALLVTEFRQAGIACEQLTDDDDDDTREEAIGRLESGATTVLVNCFLLSYGIDIPRVECVVLARPTRSVVLYLQAVGRGLRPSEGKQNLILIDHGRVVASLGRPTREREWSLCGRNVNQAARELAGERITPEEQPRECQECKYSWLVTEEGADCPACGWKHVKRALPVQVVQADLGELDPVDREEVTAKAMEQFFAEACSWYARRYPDRWELKPGGGRFWAWQQTKTKFKRHEDEAIPRRYWDVPLKPISKPVEGWLKSQQIRWAKGKQREQQRAQA